MTTGDLKIGSTFMMDGNVYVVVEWQHVCQPRLAAFIRGRIKNVETGAVLERNFKTNEKVDEAIIEKKEMQYLYNDGDLYYFMDKETFDQVPLNKADCEDALKYIVENMDATINYCNGRVISVTPPLFVELKIVECEPAVQGDTSKSAMKPAKLETGLEIKVPLFVNNEETVRVDTRTGEYMERV
ncbi:MAG: elongation factor P [Clostridiales bacterium]|nr:elongation factor P [Candidatus Apopatousia equi]